MPAPRPVAPPPALERYHAAAGDPVRLAAVQATGLLDTPAELAFDRFTRLAHRLLGVPVCILTLVDAERDFVKSAVGLPEPLASARQVPTGAGNPSFCQVMVATGEPLTVDDARGHPTFGDFPSVRHLGAAACAGVPLRAPDGQLLGTLCAFEYAPRAWTGRDRDVLLALAEAAGEEIALRVEATAARAALEHQALHDPLTGLANRALFRDRVAQALVRRAGGREAAGQAAVLFVDLDDFKTVNDSLGHAAGDRVLTVVSERLRMATRGFDTVARLGGDEFAVLLEGMAAARDVFPVVHRILEALRAPVAVDGTRVAAEASVGIAHVADDDDVEHVLRNADVAMYHAKALGKRRYAVYEPALRAARAERAALEAELRSAIEDAGPGGAADAARPGELRLVYQPVVELDGGAAASVEALLRWHSPRRGLVSPADFIPLAEESGLILPLGRWVLAEACAQLARWERALGPAAAPCVAVNVSGRQLDEPDIVRHVAAALAATGATPARLTLEITETALARDPDAVRDVLLALKALGVRLAVDDFGTGYSSLAYLQQFPVDVLKIDKRFIDGVALGGSDAALARTIIALGQTLGLRTVAEGVERAEQRDELAALGCASAQGYLFARPLPPVELDGWLAAHAAACGAAGAAGAVAVGAR